MTMDIKSAELALDSFDRSERRSALLRLSSEVAAGRIRVPVPGRALNLHAHTFFSYNPYGYSPSHYAWLAKKAGLIAAGIVEFDVLDGLDEFAEAGALLDLRTCVGVESRVFVPEFSDKVINSPGEPGISYHMGVGFTTTRLQERAVAFLNDMRATAARRNRELVDRVNAFTEPVRLEYDTDVLPLTPAGNATERHICLAYALKAEAMFRDMNKLARFWGAKFDADPEAFDLPHGPGLQATIRARTMKRGGIGYIKPEKGAFPEMSDMNRFVLDSGAIPALTWLDGTSDGEQAMAHLVAVAKQSGAAALNIIPDRNFTPGVNDVKLQNLYDIVKLAEVEGLPVSVGTEMNSPGLKFVDDFDSAELTPLVPVFLKGAFIFYGHSVLQRIAGLGYLSEWASNSFADKSEKNEFYRGLGELLTPGREHLLKTVSDSRKPGEILDMAKRTT